MFSDPLVVGAVVLLCLLFIKGGHALWREWQQRRQRRLQRQRDVRILIGDYRAKYGAREVLKRLEGDLKASRGRVEQLAATWKACQRQADDAADDQEKRALEQEERRAYGAFLAEARRLQKLKGAQEHLRR